MVLERNPGIPLDMEWVNNVNVNLSAIKDRVKYIGASRTLKNEYQAAWQLRAVTCLDLTTLSGDDTPGSVERLCRKAAQPIRKDILEILHFNPSEIRVGAVCVYPARVADCVRVFKDLEMDIPVASVATGFPSGQYHLRTRLAEIEAVVQDGAKEVDVVINRAAALMQDWKTVYEEVKLMRTACGEAHMKTILAIGELGSMDNVYKASLVCMMAGADFIKTSTGKEVVNATLQVGLVMARAIRDYLNRTGYKVGFKPAGGIRTAKDAINWQILMKEELGNEWMMSDLFRIGASGLLLDLEKELYKYVYKKQPRDEEFSSA